MEVGKPLAPILPVPEGSVSLQPQPTSVHHDGQRGDRMMQLLRRRSSSRGGQPKKKTNERTEKTAVVMGPIAPLATFQKLLADVEAKVGDVRSHYYRENQSCGFVYFKEEQAATRAKELFHETEFEGTTIKALSPLAFFGNEEDALPNAPDKTGRKGQDPLSSSPHASVPARTLVLKNLHFNLKQEKLLELLAELNVSPQSVNYHYDANGSFRGVAFAKYKRVEEAAAAMDVLNGLEIGGRTVRAEFKRRMSLSSSVSASSLSSSFSHSVPHQPSLPTMSSFSTHSSRLRALSSGGGSMLSFSLASSAAPPPHMPTPAPAHKSMPALIEPLDLPLDLPHHNSMPNRMARLHALRAMGSMPSLHVAPQGFDPDDMDSEQQHIMDELNRFVSDPMRDQCAFATSLTMQQRNHVHTIAEYLGLEHATTGTPDARRVVVSKPAAPTPPPATPPQSDVHMPPQSLKPPVFSKRSQSLMGDPEKAMRRLSLGSNGSNPPISIVHNDAPASSWPPRAPKGPDGTKGFTLGRGRKLPLPPPPGCGAGSRVAPSLRNTRWVSMPVVALKEGQEF